jgi:hypothetical protein
MAIFRAFLSDIGREFPTDRAPVSKRSCIVEQFDLVAVVARGLLSSPIPHASFKEASPMKNLSLGLLVAFTTTVLSGCALYFGDESKDDTWTYCGSDGYYTCEDENCQWVSATCPEPGQGSAGGGSGGEFECRDNGDCAAGCYCGPNGVCEEAGFCTQDSDCGEGYECNEARSSCEPTTCACSNDAEAVAQGYDYCDELSASCESGTDPAGTCAGEPTCNQLPPTCQPGDVPLLGADGCWTGQCQSVFDCAAPASCSHIQDAETCSGRSDCAQTVNGINCRRSDGSACQAGDSGCTCDSYVFAGCRDAATP